MCSLPIGMACIVDESTALPSALRGTEEVGLGNHTAITRCQHSSGISARPLGGRLERQSVNFPRYTQVCSTLLAGLFERFRRITMSSELVLISLLEEPRTQWFLRFFPAAKYPQLATVLLAGEGS